MTTRWAGYFALSNPANYYAMKLKIIDPGASGMVSLLRYAVIDGQETGRFDTTGG